MDAVRVRRWMRGFAVPASAALLGVLAGCGASAGAGGSQPLSTATATSATSATSPQLGDVSSTTVTVTASGSPLTTTTSTTDLQGYDRPPILLGDMNTPEQFIIGQLYQDVLATQGYTVALNRNIGPTSISEAAMQEGDLDVFPEYLNVYDSQVAGIHTVFGSLQAALAAGRRWAAAHGEVLLAPTPFSDTTGIAVLTSYAHAHGLSTVGDLSRVQDQLALGAPLEFSVDPNGLAALERVYGLTPALTSVINLPNQYTSLRVGALQATVVQTSDAQLADPRYADLRDNRHVLGFGNVVPVVSAKILAAEGPAFAAAIDQVDALLSTRAMRGLAGELNSSADPAAASTGVAEEFLQGNGLAPPPPWAMLTTTVTTTTPAPSTTAAP